MKTPITQYLLAGAISISLVQSVCAFDVFNQSEAQNPISKPDNTPILAGEFVFRLGYFNFSSDLGANNSAIVANQNNLAALTANFVQLFNFDPAQQAEGDTGAYSTAGTRNPNGDVGVNAGGPGLIYAYLLTTDAVWTAAPYSDFVGKQMYVWVQLVSDPGQQAIFTSTNAFTFNPGNDPFNNSTNFILGESNPNLNVLVGNDRTGAAFNDFQVVPEPSTYALAAAGGLALLLLRRRRRTAQA